MKVMLPMIRIANVVMIYVRLWDRINSKYRSMLITCDTGASVTTIDSVILRKLGYDTSAGDRHKIITASGSNYIRSVFLDMKISEIEHEQFTDREVFFRDFEVHAHTFPAESYSMGVLGLNAFERFDSVNFVFGKNQILFTITNSVSH